MMVPPRIKIGSQSDPLYLMLAFCSSGPISSGNPASHRLLSTFTDVKIRGLGPFCQEKVRFSLPFFLQCLGKVAI